MRLIKENFEELKYFIQRELCAKIREIKIDKLSNRWFCVNCGTEQGSGTCLICKRNDYLVPDNKMKEQILDSQAFFDTFKQSIHKEINETFKSISETNQAD